MSIVRPTVRDVLVRIQFASQVCELRAPLGQVVIDEEPGVRVACLVVSLHGLRPYWGLYDYSL